MTTRARILEAMERQPRFTITGLAEACSVDRASVDCVVAELKGKNCVRCAVPRRASFRNSFTLYVFERAPEKPAANGRDRMWSAMRILRQFSIPDLAAVAVCKNHSAEIFVYALFRNGYLRVVRPRASGVKMGSAIYALVNDTGPLAPRLRSDGTVYDANLAPPRVAPAHAQAIISEGT
jgi:hypothetical protein